MNKLSNQSKLYLGLVIITTMLIIFGMYSSILKGLEQDIQGGKTTEDIYIHIDEPREPFGNILTQTFTFYNTETNEPELFATGEIELSTIIDAVNNFLDTSNYKVCELGVIGDKLYIEQDTREIRDTTNGKLRVNIISLSSDLGTEDWFEVIEQIYNENDVMAGSTITNYTSFGSRHYIYAYQAKVSLEDSQTETSSNKTDNETDNPKLP